MMRILCFFGMFILTLSSIDAYDASPPCFRELETHFFDESALNQTLMDHRVDEGAWALILNDLRHRSAQVPALVKRAAAQQKPNPLESPFQADKAQKILMEVLYRILAETLAKYNVTNDQDVMEMFVFFQGHHKDTIMTCFQSKSSSNKGNYK